MEIGVPPSLGRPSKTFDSVQKTPNKRPIEANNAGIENLSFTEGEARSTKLS